MIIKDDRELMGRLHEDFQERHPETRNMMQVSYNCLFIKYLIETIRHLEGKINKGQS